jgi:hypothetical protein
MVNKLYVNPEASRTWTDAATGGDELLDLGGLAADGVVMGSFHDLGVAPRSEFYMYELFIDSFDTVPVIGQGILAYLSFSNTTTGFDGKPTTDPTTTAEGVMTADQLRNCLWLDGALVYSTGVGNEMKISGKVRIPFRYVSPIVHNDTDDPFDSTSESHSFILTPIPPELQ